MIRIMLSEAERKQPRQLVSSHGGGELTLVAAIIGQAVKDAFSTSQAKNAIKYKQNALEYFASPEYQKHLSMLDLPGDWLPAGMEFASRD